ncbi:MAG: leucine-rich repeat domain-containing protein, partial [Candidatus Marinimicrobia bacterium]|nr:leucine-rich repeat domain-containing protein [Candidatus Neomarinimicrobiota bacterium]
MKLFISILMLSQIIFSQCESQFYDESEYYYYPNLNESHVGSTLDCYYSTDWDILVELISLNNLSNMEVGELGYQNWDENGRLKNFTLDYSVSNSPQYIDQKINTLPENFGELEMLESLEMYYHNLTVFPISFPQLENLKALNMKGNRLKILNANFGSLSSLEVLDLGYNDLVALPESISGLINMNYFWIFGNDISYIPDSVCELDIDWSGESGDFIYFGSGGNHLCGDVPTCVESSLFFNIMLEEQGYAFQIESEQVCACNDGSYPDCEEQCPDAENYGSIIDACGVCNFPEDACISDCAGNWGSIAILDECGICDGDGSACEDVGTLSLIDDVDTWLVSYNSPFSISSIHFEVEGAIATTAMGFGSTMFFATSINEIIEGSFFPTVLSGEGTLLTVLFDGIPTSLNNITVTDANNTSHPFIFDDGNIEICDNGFDCLGECGGPAILDTCGICDGDGTSTWYADNDGDGLGDSQNSSSFCYEYENYVSNSNDTDDLEF